MLFEISNGVLIVSEHALMIEPFASIWQSDPTPKKENALKLFKYVDLVCSPKKSNPYFGYSEDTRPKKVKKEIYKDENYATTDYMIACVERYKELLHSYSPTYDMLTSALTAADKLKKYFDSFDFDERTKGGIQVIKPKEITAALKELPDTAKGIAMMRDKVNFELAEESRTRNQREIGQYER